MKVRMNYRLCVKEELRNEISKWLSPIDFVKRKQAILQDYVPDTVHWFFESDVFLAWYDGTASKTLYIEGNPGAGKTMLASLTADHLLSKRHPPQARKVAVLSAYYDFNSTGQQRCADMLAGILKQFLQEGQSIHPAIRKLHEDFAKKGRPFKSDLLKVLSEVARVYQTVFLLLDSLDECADRNDLNDLVHAIQQLANEQSVDIRFLTTSRPNILTEQLVGGMKTTYHAQERDLSLLLEDRIGSVTEFINDAKFWTDVRKRLVSTASGT